MTTTASVRLTETIRFATVDQFADGDDYDGAARMAQAEREAELALTRGSELQLREWLERGPHDVLWLVNEVRALREELDEADELLQRQIEEAS